MRFIIIIVCMGFFSTLQAITPTESLHLDWMNKDVAPQDDFFSYVNGNWAKQHPIPADHAIWGTFHILQEQTQTKIHQLVMNAAAQKNPIAGSLEQKIGDFYASGMDTDAINKMGIQPLRPLFDSITGINNLSALIALIPKLHLIGVDVFFNISSMQDYKNSTLMITGITQGGLGLPDRDYYLNPTPSFQRIRTLYIGHIQRLFQLLGDDKVTAKKEALAVMQIETTLAKGSMSLTAQRDPSATYHIMNLTQLAELAPNFSWSAYLTAMGLKPDVINVAMPDFIKCFNQQLNTVSLSDWKTYLRFHVIDAFAPYLSTPFIHEQFKMSRALTGVKILQPRWKRVIKTETGALGFGIGELYIKQYYSLDAQQKILSLFQSIRNTLRNDLQTLTWMAPTTRLAAIKKLNKMEERIGYPTQWWDYSGLVIDRGLYVLNVIRANQFLIKRDLSKIGKPVDRTEWAMPPQTINAYYDASMNSINIPAGILQTPFFDPDAPAAFNYGAIGFVMGHEITHGFDDQGAKFDGDGNLNNWWSPEDLKKFQEATNCILKQFSQYRVNNTPVQGALVVGEATADLGGLTLAYRAFRQSDAYKQAKTIQGFTPDQQFFLGAAHVWASNIRPELAQQLITTDPHPPNRYRVNGTLANMPAFQTAFRIPSKSPMVNIDRCVIW